MCTSPTPCRCSRNKFRQAEYLAVEAHALRPHRRRCCGMRFDRQLAHQASRSNTARRRDILRQHRHLLVLPQVEAGLSAVDDGATRPALAEIWRGSEAGRHRRQNPCDRSALSRWPRLDRRVREILRRSFCQRRPELLVHTAFNFKISSDLMWLAARLRAAAAKGTRARSTCPPHSLRVVKNGRGYKRTCPRNNSISSTE